MVKEYFDANAEHEWNRLFQDGYHRLEYTVHTHFLNMYLPRRGLILDAGGGPGRYTIELSKKGYQMVLLDLSPKCLEIAKREIRNAKVESRVKKIVEDSVVDLSEFKDASFDGVLCFGALSHLIKRTEREKAVSELVRVTKKKAPLFVSVINRYGVFRTILQRYPNEVTDQTHQETFSEGVHHAHYIPSHPTEGFTDAYFFLPNELRELFEKKGVQTLDMANCEGLSSHLQEETNAVYNDSANGWNRWLKIILQTCNDPCILGLGEHLLYVGRKKL